MKHGWSITLGRVYGTVVRIHLTFLLLLIWIGIAGWSKAGAASAWFDIVFIVLLFGCVLLHEFGHVMAARAYGIATSDITLYPIGGLANIQTRFENPRQELVIASAGPAVSLMLAILLMLIAGGPAVSATLVASTDWRMLAGLLATTNLALALFNLLPAFPMDGGRILRALLSWWLGRSAGTHIAVWAGRVGGIVFIVYGLAQGQILLALIGVFILLSASAEAVASDLDRALSGKIASSIMASDVATLSDFSTLTDGIAALIHTEQHLFPIVDRATRPVSLISRDQIIAAARTHDADTALTELAGGAPDIVGAADPAIHALALLERGAPAVLVTHASGELAGLISWDNLTEFRPLARRPLGREDRHRLQAQGNEG